MGENALDPATFRALRLEREGDVLRVTIAHPTSELNAVDALLHDELGRLFRGLRRESAARASGYSASRVYSSINASTCAFLSSSLSASQA